MSRSLEISRVTKGILVTVILSFLLTLLLSLIYYFTSLHESPIHSIITAGISVLFASFYVSFQSGSRGLFYGLAIGLGFFLLSIIIYYLFYDSNPSWRIVLGKFSVCLASGIIGGTIGAILKR
jgi:putative membrane protein (TIGR04086 family)